MADLVEAGAAPARLTVALRHGVSLWQVRLRPDRFAAGSARLGAALRVALPPPGASAPGPGGRLYRAAPLVWRLLDAPEPADGGAPEALRALMAGDGAVAELGPGLARFAIGGAAAVELLARAVSLDLRPAAFPPGSVAVTGWRRSDVTLLRPEDGGFALFVPLSVAEDCAEVLDRHARQFG